MRALLTVAVIASLGAATVGCVAPAATVAPEPAVAKRQTPRIALSGVAQAPSSLLANHGSGLISANGGNVVSGNSASWQILAVEELAPVADAEVTVVDENDQPIEGIAPVKTDAEGRFTVPGVPMGRNVLVAVKRPGLSLTSLVRPEGEAKVEVTPASTLVAAHLKKELAKDRKALRHVPKERVKELEQSVKEAIDKGEAGLELASEDKALAAFERIQEKHPEVAQVGQAAVAEAHAAKTEAEKREEAEKPEPTEKPEAAEKAGPENATDAAKVDERRPEARPSEAPAEKGQEAERRPEAQKKE